MCVDSTSAFIAEWKENQLYEKIEMKVMWDNREINSEEKESLVLLRLTYYNDHTGPKQKSSLPRGLRWLHQCIIMEMCY